MQVHKTPQSDNPNVTSHETSSYRKVRTDADPRHPTGVSKKQRVDLSTFSEKSTSTGVTAHFPATGLRPNSTKNELPPNWPAGFRPSQTDVCTNKRFSTLMEDTFRKHRPYCFATAISQKEKTSEKVFLDGRSFMSGWNEGPFDMPLSVYYNK